MHIEKLPRVPTTTECLSSKSKESLNYLKNPLIIFLVFTVDAGLFH